MARQGLASAICYRDPRAALAWLEKAFGFETVMLIEGPDGAIVHSQMDFGDSYIMVAYEWDEAHKSPASLDGKNTQSIHIQVEADIDAHCERARAAGATITQEPTDQFYGDRSYRCLDPEGHFWTVGQTVAVVSREEAEKITGLKITGWV
jgi:uncharacterized glyoxalase superfamily protein PhnB